jgi:hypothetical protein
MRGEPHLRPTERQAAPSRCHGRGGRQEEDPDQEGIDKKDKRVRLREIEEEEAARWRGDKKAASSG